MTAPQPRNMAASVHHRLVSLAHERREESQNLLTRYALERLLFRLSQSAYRDRFILKGAMLFTLWSGEPYRATQDLDLLGSGGSAIAPAEHAFRDICRVPVVDDGLEFKADTVRGGRIREDQEYEGLRIKLTAYLGKARIPLQIDIGFGDAVVPAPEEVEYPTLLDFPKPSIRAYPRETVVAEKFQAVVALGIANTRIKDFYDLWTIARRFSFGGETLCQAIEATFARRRTPLPTEAPLALTSDLGADPVKQTQWQAFLRRGRLSADGASLADVTAALQAFLMPPASALAEGRLFDTMWPASGPWQPPV